MSINSFPLTRYGSLPLLCWFNTHLDIKAHVFVSFVMSSIQFRDELTALHTRVLSKRTWQRLKGFGKLLDSILLQSRAGLWQKHSHVSPLSQKIRQSQRVKLHVCADKAAYLSVGSELLGQFDLCGACSRYQLLVLRN